MNPRTIVIPVDGSAGSAMALEYGGRLAARLGAGVVIVNVADSVGCDARLADHQSGRNALPAPSLGRAVAQLTELGVTPTLCLRAGEPWREIVAEGERRPRSIIVMASRGTARASEPRTSGSVAGAVARNSACPVLILPLEGGASAPLPMPGSTVLVPLDGSNLAELALKPAAALAKATGARLLLLQVQEVPSTTGAQAESAWLTERVAEERWYLEQAARHLRPRGIAVDTVVLTGRPSEVLQASIEQSRPSLVVMTTHGRGTIGRWLVGSVADSIIERTTVPLLLVNPLGYHGDERALNRIRLRPR